MDWDQLKELAQQNFEWLWQAGLAILATVAIALVWRAFRKRLQSLIRQSKQRWGHSLLKAFGIPINGMILVVGATWLAEITAHHLSKDILNVIALSSEICTMLLVAWGFWRLVSSLEERLLKKEFDTGVITLSSKILRLIITAVAALSSLHIFEISLSELFSFDGISFLWKAALSLAISLGLALSWLSLRKYVGRTIGKNQNRWPDIALKGFGIPINWLIIILGLCWFADISARHFSAEVIPDISIFRKLSILAAIAWAVWRMINAVEIKQLAQGSDATTVQLVGKIAKLTLGVMVILPAFQILGIAVSGMLAFGGMGGLIVGMASKDLLANFFGSIMIYLDRPFKIGDWIRSPDREIEGTVESIGFRLTIIRTFDKRPLYVPNSAFTNISVENPSRMKNRRIKETFGVRYEDAKKIPAILDDVRSMLEQHDDIDVNQTLIVNLNSFAASSLDFFIYTFTKTTDWVQYHHIKQDVMLQVLNIIHKHEADCAFPTQTLHIDSIPDSLEKS